MTAAANNITGAEGTKVKLEIQRGQEIKTFEITRKKITTNPVIAEKLDNNIGYLEVTSFDENTAENFKSKYEELKAQGRTKKIKYKIINNRLKKQWWRISRRGIKNS